MRFLSDGKIWRKRFFAYNFHLLASEQRLQMCTLSRSTNMWKLANLKQIYYHNTYTLNRVFLYNFFAAGQMVAKSAPLE
jgi:hypothetical protein